MDEWESDVRVMWLGEWLDDWVGVWLNGSLGVWVAEWLSEWVGEWLDGTRPPWQPVSKPCGWVGGWKVAGLAIMCP